MSDTVKEFYHDDELCIYERGGIYQARVYAGNRRYVTRSLKTRDIAAARKAGERFYYETRFKQEEDRPVGRKTWASVVNEYVAAREAQYATGLPMTVGENHKAKISWDNLRQIRRVSKFWLEYCGHKPIEWVDNTALRDYVTWRRDYYPSRLRAGVKVAHNCAITPKDKTLEWELTFGKTVWRWAAERRLTGNLPAPNWGLKNAVHRARPAFEVSEYANIIRWLRSRGREIADPQRGYTYNLLANYVAILAATGMRVGEANNLHRSDVIEFKDELGRLNYMIKVRGKTGDRIVIPRQSGVQWINHQRGLWVSFKGMMELSGQTLKSYHKRSRDDDGDWFFKMPDGSRVLTLIEQFNSAMAATGTATTRYGDKRTLYSLRHFYAVQMLRKGVPVYDIARNMGTSVIMIENYYGKQATPLALATSLGN